jgi:hypothetical protein
MWPPVPPAPKGEALLSSPRRSHRVPHNYQSSGISSVGKISPPRTFGETKPSSYFSGPDLVRHGSGRFEEQEVLDGRHLLPGAAVHDLEQTVDQELHHSVHYPDEGLEKLSHRIRHLPAHGNDALITLRPSLEEIRVFRRLLRVN